MSKEIEVVWYGGQRGSWCAAIVEFLTEGFVHRMDVGELKGEGAIVVVKADQVKDANRFCEETAFLRWILLVVTANEDGTSAIHESRSPRCKVWLQTPHRHQTADHFIPWGWTPGCATEVHAKKIWDWSFAGQITHARRQQFKIMVRENPKVRDGLYSLVESDGFAKGVPQDMYYRLVAGAKVVPCPSGPVTVDSMRVCEALNLSSVPVLDCVSPTGPYPEYWQRVFPGHPFELVSEWRMFPFQLEHILRNWDMVSEVVRNYWTLWKANLRVSFHNDLCELGAL